MKNNMLIHRMADWLERKYLRPNTVSARARLPPSPSWYRPSASNENAATASISAASGRQNQPSQIKLGMAHSRMPFSYPSMKAA